MLKLAKLNVHKRILHVTSLVEWLAQWAVNRDAIIHITDRVEICFGTSAASSVPQPSLLHRVQSLLICCRYNAIHWQNTVYGDGTIIERLTTPTRMPMQRKKSLAFHTRGSNPGSARVCIILIFCPRVVCTWNNNVVGVDFAKFLSIKTTTDISWPMYYINIATTLIVLPND